MLVLHATFHQDCLHLWGESSPEAAQTDSPPARLSAYPYRTAISVLRDRLALAGLSLSTSGPTPCESTIWLPTQGDAPLPSSPLVAEPPPSRKSPTLAPWTIPTLALTPADAVQLLTTVRARPAIAPGVGIGDALRYWSEALQFAGALVDRQQVLPDLAEPQRDVYWACSPALARRRTGAS